MRRLVVALLCTLGAGSVHAQGVSIHSHSACALGRNSAGVAQPCADGSAIFYNPAAMTSAPSVASTGVLALHTQSSFRFDTGGPSHESTQATKLAPHAWLALQITPAIAAGIGIWAPYGLATKWDLDFEGRYTGYDNTLRAIYIQPTVATSFLRGRLAVGAGLDIVNCTVELHRRIDLARTTIPNTQLAFSVIGVPEATDFADGGLEIDDWSATFQAGVQYRPSERWAFGVRYLHSTKLALSGRAQFSPVTSDFLLPAGNPFGLPAGTPIDMVLARQFDGDAPLSDQFVGTELTLPNQFVTGIRFAATEALNLFLDYQWTGWQEFNTAVLNFARAPADSLFLNFRNTGTIRFAAEHAASGELTIRGGVLYNTAAAPDVTVIPLLPEAKRASFAIGLGYRFTHRLMADGGFEAVFQEERRGSVRPRETRAQTAAQVNVGRYASNAWFGGVTLSYALGRARAIRNARSNPEPIDR